MSLGSILTVGATLLSLAIAFWGFHNSYYLSPLLPAFMVFYILLAWLLYLKDTGALFLTSSRKPIKHPESPTAKDLPEDKISGAELLDIRDESGLIRRRPEPGDNERAGDDPDRPHRSTIRALLWSALELAILATVLYHFFGVGASL